MIAMVEPQPVEPDIVSKPVTAVELSGVIKRLSAPFGKAKRAALLDGLDMSVPQGAVYGLLGPNGSGKSTVLRIIATLVQPDEGSVKICGIDPASEPREVRKRIAYLPDWFGIYEGITCEEYLDYYGRSYSLGVQIRKAVIADLLELVEMAQYRASRVETLSRGLKQRLGIARCLLHDPDVLLLDDPVTAMDARGRAEVREVLHELGRLGKTTILTSCVLADLDQTCTHLGILTRGRLVREGTRAEVLDEEDRSQLPVVLISIVDPSEMDRAVACARLVQGVSHAEAVDGDIMVTLRNEQNAAGVLSSLVGSGIRVVGCFPLARTSDSLEDRYLSLVQEGAS